MFELAAVLGRPPSKAPGEAESCVLPPQLTDLIPVGDGATLLKRRPDVRQAERRLAAATARIGVAVAALYPQIELRGFIGGASTEPSQFATNNGIIWGIGPAISWNFPNQAAPRARVRQAKANAAAALAAFDGVVLEALKETEQALAVYAAELDHRQALAEAQDRAQKAFDMAHGQYIAGAISDLDLLTSEQQLVAADAAVAGSDAALILDQVSVFKALGGGWHNTEQSARR
jgi:outer membrane protein TolC